MQNPSLVTQLLAKNPRHQARFPEVPVDQALRELEELQKKTFASKDAPSATTAPIPTSAPATAAIDPASALSGSIASIVTNLWRAKLKLVESKTGEPIEETRRVYRHVEGALETFKQLGV